MDRCPFNQQSKPILSFRDFLLQRNAPPLDHPKKMETLPTVKIQRVQKQLSQLLAPELTDLLKRNQSQDQQGSKDSLKTTFRKYQSQENSPMKPGHSSVPQLGDLLIPSPHFKFNSTRKTHFRQTISTRNCFEQLQQLRKTHRPKPQAREPTLTEHQIVSKFFERKDEKYPNFLIYRQKGPAVKPVGSSERLEYETDILFGRITNDRSLRTKYQSKSIKHLKHVFSSLLRASYDSEVLIDPVRLRQIHAPLLIKKDQFTRFKYHFINQYLEMETPVEQIFKGCQKIENMRSLVLNKPLDFEIFGGDQGISLTSTIMYDKIFKDYTLSPYFKTIELEKQAMKFAKLFAQLIDHTDSPNYTLETLRERHVKYKLTYVQLANFKFYLSTSLQELKIRFSSIRSILRGMDTYKFAILNKDSLQECISKVPGGFKEFIEIFVRLCMQDPVLFDLIQKRGKPRFTQHCENMFHYFFRNKVKAITRCDLDQIHKCKSIISENVFDKMRQRAMLAVSKVTDDQTVINDFAEDWDEVKPFILGNSKHITIKHLGGQSLINQLAQKIEYEIQQRPSLNRIFEDNDSAISSNLKCKLNLILYGVHFYKKQDLEVLHKRLHISEQSYYEFQQVIRNSLEGIPQLHWVNTVLEEYKPHIIFEY